MRGQFVFCFHTSEKCRSRSCRYAYSQWYDEYVKNAGSDDNQKKLVNGEILKKDYESDIIDEESFSRYLNSSERL